MKQRCILKNKKAFSGHIETIMSFVIFIGFVFFIIIFVRPFDSNFVSSSIVSGLHYHFTDIVKTQIITSFVSVSDIYSGDCIKINLDNEIITNEFNSSLIKKENKETIASQIQSNTININDAQNKSYYIYLSDFFEQESFSCTNFDGKYKISRISKEELIPLKKLENIKKEYENNYDNLKRKLGIPEVFDFSINSEIISLERTISASEVLSKDYIEKVMLNDGTIKYIRFTFSVWR